MSIIVPKHKYTWKKQKLDARDYGMDRLAAIKPLVKVAALPPVAYNRPYCSAVLDQGQLGSCTANAWAGLLGYNECKNGRGGKLFHFMSRLFIYYNERLVEGTVSTDSGAQLRDGAAVLANSGSCYETEWPYVVSQFAVKPPAQCYTDAVANEIHSYYALNTLTDMKTCLASGLCFVFGFTVYSSFESDAVAATGVVPMPANDEQVLGGHAVMAVGYNDAEQRFLIKNSWGTNWGLTNPFLRGYCTMPYAYLTNPNLASDFWTVVKDV